MARRYYSSTAARTTLASGVNDSTTTFTVAAVSGWPSSFPYTLIIDQDTINEEIVEVTARSGTTLTVTRGVDGTTGVAHDAGAAVNHGVSARDFDEPNAFIEDTNGKLGGGTPITATSADSLVIRRDDSLFVRLQRHTDGDAPAYLLLEKSGGTSETPTTPAQDERLGLIGFRGYSEEAAAYVYAASIEARVDGEPDTAGDTTDMPGRLMFRTTPDGSSSSAERMRINNAGAVMIGTTTPGSAGAGDLVVNGGVFLGGSAAANELDDYEEGTWTPTYEPTTGSFGSITYDTATTSGFYTKIGRVVYIQAWLRTDAITIGTAAGTLRVGGLPFMPTDLAGGGNQTPIAVGESSGWSGEHPSGGRFRESNSQINLYYRSASDGAALPSAPNDLSTGVNANDLSFSGFYITS